MNLKGENMKAYCDDYYALSSTLNDTSRRRTSILESKKYGKQNSSGTLKFVKSKGPFKKEQMCILGVARGSRWVCRRDGEDVEKPKSDKDVVLQRDLDAAYALLELASECPSFSKSDLHSSFVNGKPPIKALVSKRDIDKGSYCNDCDSWVCKRTSQRCCGKYRESVVEDCDSVHFSLSKAAYPAERMCKKMKVGNGYSLHHSGCRSGYVSEGDDRLYETYRFVDGHERSIRLGDKSRQHNEACLSGSHHRLGMLLSVSNWAAKNLRGNPDQLIHESPNLKKRRLQKADAKGGVPSNLPSSERKCMDDIGSETNFLEQSKFTLITPTNAKGFTFSIIHLLSAVRIAMIMAYTEDGLMDGKEIVKSKTNGASESNSDPTEHRNFPSLTIHEIVQRVKSNPGDPSILETEEPLQDLVRGILKIFSSKVAPLGAKGWKALTTYEKSSKSWTWSGPGAINSSNHDALENDISPIAWGIPHKMLEKLVDSFANWLKSGQETLQQIGALPAPPPTLVQPTVDFEEIRHPGNKSFTTIGMSSEEARAYFRIEEALRYQIPDRIFFYTAVDGKKSAVAPSGRCSVKPSLKGRNHLILKPDRPPHVTILCLVRDAAARLPGGIGTRADVCTLMRDSQYIVEDISETQMSQTVSGALDRLHSGLDPCVRYNRLRKLWVYLHRDRKGDEFEDDCNSCTWKLKYKTKLKHDS